MYLLKKMYTAIFQKALILILIKGFYIIFFFVLFEKNRLLITEEKNVFNLTNGQYMWIITACTYNKSNLDSSLVQNNHFMVGPEMMDFASMFGDTFSVMPSELSYGSFFLHIFELQKANLTFINDVVLSCFLLHHCCFLSLVFLNNFNVVHY